MSAIFGIIDFKGRPIEPEWIKSMQTDLAHRGPDGEGLYQEHGVVLGYKLLQVTPESIYDKSPYDEDGFVITANARLDEREEIMNRLNVPISERDTITDPLLLLRSFRKFGKDFVKDIYGDFAFAIWDIGRKELFCARDQIGVKPFLYYFQDGRFAFSTELKTLVRLPFVDTEADNFKMRDEAIGIYDSPITTTWKNIFRIQAAHHLSISQGNFKKERFWDLVAEENIIYKTEEQSAKALKKLLFKVIDDHTRVIDRVGVPLSGGLDSSTIACIAARKFARENKKIVTASSVLDPKTDNGELKDEMEYIAEVHKQEPNIEPAFVYHTELEFLNDLDSKFEKHFTPVVRSHYVDEALNNQFSSKSVRRILSGFLGDSTISNSSILPLPNLLIRGRFLSYFRASKRYRKNMNLRFWFHLRRNVIQPMIPINFQEIIYFLIKKKSPWDISGLPLPPSKTEEKSMEKRMRDWWDKYVYSHYDVANKIWDYQDEELGEGWDCGPSHQNLEYTYPLLDRRLIEFLVQLPLEHFYAGGLRRGLIRKSMIGLLPEKIRLRMNKLPYSPAYEQIHKLDLPKVKVLLVEENLKPEVKKVIDVPKTIFLIEKIEKSENPAKIVNEFGIIVDLSVWIKFVNWLNMKETSKKKWEKPTIKNELKIKHTLSGMTMSIVDASGMNNSGS